MKKAPNAERIPFETWVASYGRTRQTGHRWRQQLPWLAAEITNIMGRLYISEAGARKFEEMAAAGKLATRHSPPPPGSTRNAKKRPPGRP